MGSYEIRETKEMLLRVERERKAGGQAMIQVKWVDSWYDTPEDVPKQWIKPDLEVVPVAVVPLSALTEVVEGLKGTKSWLEQLADRFEDEWPNTATHCRIHVRAIENTIAQLESHTK